VGLCGTRATTGVAAGEHPWFVPRPSSAAGRRHTQTAEAGEQGP